MFVGDRSHGGISERQGEEEEEEAREGAALGGRQPVRMTPSVEDEEELEEEEGVPG